MTLAPGDRVGPYEVIDAIGEGAMGEVYRARSGRPARVVALKVLRARRGAGPDTDRLLREARAVAQLEHRNLVTLLDVGVAALPGGDVAYLAMELIDGSPLRAFVGDARISMSARLRWLGDVALGLAAAHRRGLVHRDVKPENVVVGVDGVAKVLDFGLAEAPRAPAIAVPPTELAATLSAAGIPAGTPPYMAPEQLRGESLDGRADQFAWGVVAYELLSGRRPWGEPLEAVPLIAAVLDKPAAPLTEILRDVAPSVSSVVARALAKSKDARFATMDDLATALRHASSPTPAKSPPRGSPWPRRALVALRGPKHAAVGVGALLLAFFGVLAIALTWASTPTPLAGSQQHPTFVLGCQPGQVGCLSDNVPMPDASVVLRKR